MCQEQLIYLSIKKWNFWLVLIKFAEIKEYNSTYLLSSRLQIMQAPYNRDTTENGI